MFFLLAQVAPVTSQSGAGAVPTLDCVTLVLGVLAALGPLFTYLAARFHWGRAGKLVTIMQDASDLHQKGEPWSLAVLDAAERHGPELLALATSALPESLAPDDKAPPAAP